MPPFLKISVDDAEPTTEHTTAGKPHTGARILQTQTRLAYKPPCIIGIQPA
jgi:hypothetical protein